MHSLNKLLFPSFKGLALFSLSLGFLGLSPCPLSAATLDDLQFTLINNDTEYSVSAKDPSNTSGVVTIPPPAYNGKPVTTIGAFGFATIGTGDIAKSQVTSVVLPNTITSIGESAFGHCIKLTSINFSQATALTTIGKDAFAV